MNKEVLCRKIDQKAIEICRMMTPEEKEVFFTYQEDRWNSGLMKKKYFSGRTYYKGKRKGEEKDVYEINGQGFNELWKLLSNYAKKVVDKFYFANKMFDDEGLEDFYDIKYQTFEILRFFGPTPNGSSFSSFFPLICKNTMTNSFVKRYGSKDKVYTKEEAEDLMAKGKKNLTLNENGDYVRKGIPSFASKINYQTVSLFKNIMVETDDDEGTSIINMFEDEENNSYKEIEFLATVPDDMKEIVDLVLKGKTLFDISSLPEINMSRKELKEQLQTLL
ncbi:MAG: hypothetical protein M0R03_16145 [Novosphingobium sp.]|nr:hypothetical protein [Novosphingobium sp.]